LLHGSRLEVYPTYNPIQDHKPVTTLFRAMAYIIMLLKLLSAGVALLSLYLWSAGSPSAMLLLLVSIYIFGAVILALFDFYFISVSYIIVYVGAIAILFLFIIMMIAPGPKAAELGWLIAAGLIPCLAVTISNPTTLVTYGPATNSWTALQFSFYDIHSMAIFMINAWPLAIVTVGILITSVIIGILD
jgi:NADH:ubiquinone oxidoreductase subunit 6 (subunit J)